MPPCTAPPPPPPTMSWLSTAGLPEADVMNVFSIALTGSSVGVNSDQNTQCDRPGYQPTAAISAGPPPPLGLKALTGSCRPLQCPLITPVALLTFSNRLLSSHMSVCVCLPVIISWLMLCNSRACT